MAEYRVKWEIDIEADSPIEAAACAKWHQAHGDWSSVFEVNWLAGKEVVDLDEEVDEGVWIAIWSSESPDMVREAVTTFLKTCEVKDEQGTDSY